MERWTYIYNGQANSSDIGWSVAYGLDGNIYAAGWSYGDETNDDFVIISLTSNGIERWVYRYNGPGNYIDEARALAYGLDGNIYAAGWSYGIAINHEDFTVISLTSDGVERWVYRYNGAINYARDEAHSVVFGSDGNIYAAGYSQGNGTYSDFTVISLTSDGIERWIYRYNGPIDSMDNAYSIVYGLDNNIYSAGWSQGENCYDFTVISLTSDGTERWIYKYNGPGNGADLANSIVYGLDDNIYVAGKNWDWNTGSNLVVISLNVTKIEEQNSEKNSVFLKSLYFLKMEFQSNLFQKCLYI